MTGTILNTFHALNNCETTTIVTPFSHIKYLSKRV